LLLDCNKKRLSVYVRNGDLATFCERLKSLKVSRSKISANPSKQTQEETY
jgi:hypothetical protein